MRRFKIKRSSETFVLENESGQELTYTVKEMNGVELEDYLNSSRKNVIMSDGKVTGMKSFDGMYANLLSRTVYDENGELVLRPDIDLWPASVQRDLYELAQELNGLSAESASQSKNG